MASTWFIKGNTATVSQTFYDESTGLATNTTGTPTVTITASDGVTTYTPSAVTTTGTTYTATFTPTALDTDLAIQWSGTVAGASQVVTNYADIIGAWPVTIAQLRSFRKEFSDTTRYSYQGLLDSRVAATKYLNQLLDTSLVPMFSRYTTPGRAVGSNYLLTQPFEFSTVELPHWNVTTVRSVKVNGAAVTLSSLFIDYKRGVIKNLYASPGSTIAVEYEYGYTTVPADGVRPLLMLITDHALPNTANPRSISIDADTGFHNMKNANTDGTTGIPEVDAFIARHSRRLAFGIA